MRVDRTARSGRSWSVKLRVGVRTLWAAAQGQRAARAASGSRSSFLPPPLTENRLWSPAGTWFVHPDFVTKFVDRDNAVAGPRHRAKYGRFAPRFLEPINQYGWHMGTSNNSGSTRDGN